MIKTLSSNNRSITPRVLFRRALVIKFARLIAREATGDAADKHRKLQLNAE